MAKVICPKCGNESFFSLQQDTYEGPYRCTSCRVLFTVKIVNDEVQSAQLMDQQAADNLKTHNPYK